MSETFEKFIIQWLLMHQILIQKIEIGNYLDLNLIQNYASRPSSQINALHSNHAFYIVLADLHNYDIKTNFITFQHADKLL